MEDEPLLLSQSRFHLRPIPENSSAASAITTHSISPTIFSPEAVQPHDRIHEEPHERSETDPESHAGAPVFLKSRSLHRCRTAPAMVVIKDLRSKTTGGRKPSPVSKSIIKQAMILLVVYLTLGVAIYSFNRDHYSGVETHPVVDALYFCIVTMCTIGYGDIAPLTPATKIFAVVFVLFGFGFLDILLSGVVNYVLDLQESMILTGIQMGSSRNRERFSARDYIVDVEKGRMRIRLKVGLALCVVVLCIGVGSLVLFFVERLDWVDSVYLSVMSVTTVGYGDRAFKTLEGRLFAAIWLLVSTLAVARAFLYLAEARIDRRHRKAVKLALHRDITVEDLLAADTYQHGFISRSMLY
ncbi:PREDICTED: two-pore potassium channel 5 isoform X2 [Tarenaya hassleriana]|uniref:two-pore potassium channel 5 isoform X2 n=1 Tax=Tarenaya hassleriana TaxID=28532 RepID=UPI00053C44CB|nr:PREDICTED: two-pore potassium channel 5 isoform X2 [Tarenaya hassleriana]